MSRRLWLAVALVCTLFACPVSAYADDGFIGGLQDFAGVREVEEVQPEKQWSESYRPILKAPNDDESELTEYEDGDNIGPIGSVIDNVQYVPLYSNKVHLIDMVRFFLSSGGAEAEGLPLVGFAVLFVFVWWGVRKSLRMIMSAWRKGKQSV